jgi:hypothetical protein
MYGRRRRVSRQRVARVGATATCEIRMPSECALRSSRGHSSGGSYRRLGRSYLDCDRFPRCPGWCFAGWTLRFALSPVGPGPNSPRTFVSPLKRRWVPGRTASGCGRRLAERVSDRTSGRNCRFGRLTRDRPWTSSRTSPGWHIPGGSRRQRSVSTAPGRRRCPFFALDLGYRRTDRQKPTSVPSRSPAPSDRGPNP